MNDVNVDVQTSTIVSTNMGTAKECTCIGLHMRGHVEQKLCSENSHKIKEKNDLAILVYQNSKD